MSKTKVQKPYVKPTLEKLDPQKAAAVLAQPEQAVVEKPEQLPPPPPPVKVEGPKIRYVRVTAMLSLSLHMAHEDFCMKIGKCFCETSASGRVGKTWNLIAGIPQVVPMVWTTHPLIQSMQRSGKVLVKVLL